MLTIDYIREKCLGMKMMHIAAKTGLHYHTVRTALTAGSNPSYETVKALSDWLEEREKTPKN